MKDKKMNEDDNHEEAAPIAVVSTSRPCAKDAPARRDTLRRFGSLSINPAHQDPQFIRANSDADSDSALGDCGSTAPDSDGGASVESSVLAYRNIHGRTFQNFRDADYWYESPSLMRSPRPARSLTSACRAHAKGNQTTRRRMTVSISFTRWCSSYTTTDSSARLSRTRNPFSISARGRATGPCT